MIRLDNISKSFGTVDALKGISVNFPQSKITIIAGADGAGKSTLFRIILGLEKTDSGKIYIKDEEIRKDYSRITSISGFMPERFSLYTDLTVEENLNFFADINNVPFKRRESLKNRLLENTGMINFRNRKAGALSGGMKQKLSLSSILLSSPDLIILDEPTTGVDPLSRIEFF
ncbi:MAG: ABC transporter ATP-binding protein, partial [Acidobacteriota bacterium]